jgi:hypothetical protein
MRAPTTASRKHIYVRYAGFGAGTHRSSARARQGGRETAVKAWECSDRRIGHMLAARGRRCRGVAEPEHTRAAAEVSVGDDGLLVIPGRVRAES